MNAQINWELLNECATYKEYFNLALSLGVSPISCRHLARPMGLRPLPPFKSRSHGTLETSWNGYVGQVCEHVQESLCNSQLRKRL